MWLHEQSCARAKLWCVVGQDDAICTSGRFPVSAVKKQVFPLHNAYYPYLKSPDDLRPWLIKKTCITFKPLYKNCHLFLSSRVRELVYPLSSVPTPAPKIITTIHTSINSRMALEHWNTYIISVDPGTGSLTSYHALVHDSLDANGKMQRRPPSLDSIIPINNWPGGSHDTTIGKEFIPTTMIYLRKTGELLCWGYQAHEYLSDPYPDIPVSETYTIDHPKLLLIDPTQFDFSASTAARYIEKRKEVEEVLGKNPSDPFRDLLTESFTHIIACMHRYFGVTHCKIELVLAVPSGWVRQPFSSDCYVLAPVCVYLSLEGSSCPQFFASYFIIMGLTWYIATFHS